MNNAGEAMDEMSQNLAAAAEGLGALKGTWHAIAADLGSAVEAIQGAEDDAELDASLSQLEFLPAVEHWEDVRAKADNFRQCAFITALEEVSLAA